MYSDFKDYYEPSEFDERVEEFKDYLRESVKKDTLDKIERLTNENNTLREEIKSLKKENKEIEDISQHTTIRILAYMRLLKKHLRNTH